MKVLQVNSIADKESTGKIVLDIHNYLVSQNVDSVICYGHGDDINKESYYRICSEFERKVYTLMNRIRGLAYRTGVFSTQKLINIIKHEKPDIIHLHCINAGIINVYHLLSFLANNNIKTIVTLHAEFLFTGSCGHSYDCNQWIDGCSKCPQYRSYTKSYIFNRVTTAWKLMNESFSKFNPQNIAIYSVSSWLMKRAARSRILGKFEHGCIFNGLDTAIFSPRALSPNIKAKLVDIDKYVLYVSAQFSLAEDDNKGGRYIVDLAEQMPHIVFVIVASICLCTESLPKNILVLGKTENQEELAGLYTNATLTIVTSKRETFSMVTAESLCCGTPVVGFKAGGPESIALEEFSQFVEYGDIKKLKQSIIHFYDKEINKSLISICAHKKYDSSVMASHYFEAYQKLLF